MIGLRQPWYAGMWFLRALKTLGIFEALMGLLLLKGSHESYGVAFAALGVATFAMATWIGYRRNKFRF
jgi:hypothetical protein